jgi:NADPH:quinone reductase-like Zn-dependent oxidoreductase
MKAVLVRGYGDVNQLFYGDTPDLKPGPGEVLVRMAATSINPIDWKLRRGESEGVHAFAVPGNPGS